MPHSGKIFLDAFRTSFAIFERLSEAVFKLLDSDENLQKIVTDEDLAGQIAQLVVGSATILSKCRIGGYYVTMLSSRAVRIEYESQPNHGVELGQKVRSNGNTVKEDTLGYVVEIFPPEQHSKQDAAMVSVVWEGTKAPTRLRLVDLSFE